MGQGRPATRGNNAYQPRTDIGENNIPTTDSTSDRVEMTDTLPDFKTTPRYCGRSSMRGKLPKHMTMSRPAKKKESNLVTDNPFVPKKKFKMPKLSGKGGRSAMRGKIK